MDLLFFLQMRTEFIRDFYVEASFPFTERKRKIEDKEHPFIPPYSEEGEPTFLDEWIKADESLEVLGQMCISMLANNLHLYIKESINQLHALYRTDVGRPKENKAAFKLGWINGYRLFFREKLNIEWEKSPSNLQLLEEIFLARNSAQHANAIWTLSVEQSEQDAAKHPRSFFADEAEMELFTDSEETQEWLRPFRLNVTREKLFAAIHEVDQFCFWLEERLRSPEVIEAESEDAPLAALHS